MKKRDKIFNEIRPSGPFIFGSEVAGVFDDMASRSIPCYAELQRLAAALTLKYYRRGSKIYDLGCSTGNTIVEIMSHVSNNAQLESPSITAVDKSEEMIGIASEKCKKYDVTWICGGIEDMTFPGASVIIATYVLQFVPVECRAKIMGEIYDGLIDGGIFLLAEKIESHDSTIETEITKLYHDFKRANGYSDLEILQKARSLQGVLVPLTLEKNCELLRNAGFHHVDILIKHLNFACIIAIK